jgi:hypothetical protein
MIANMGQRRKRAVLLAVIPAMSSRRRQQCEETLHTKADTSPEAIRKMVDAFAEFGVTKEQIEARCQRRLEAIRPAQVVMLRRIYSSLRDEMSSPGDWFEATAGTPPPASGLRGNAALRSRLAQAEPPPELPEDEPEEPEDEPSAPDEPAQTSAAADVSVAATPAAAEVTPPAATRHRRRGKLEEPTEEEIARSQEALAAVLGPEPTPDDRYVDLSVVVPFDAADSVQEWFGRARSRLREMQEARLTPDRFVAYRKANAGALMRLNREFKSYWEQLDALIAAAERRGAALGYTR